jgi:hypothetical protein
MTDADDGQGEFEMDVVVALIGGLLAGLAIGFVVVCKVLNGVWR